MRGAIFLDRDGVINDHQGYVNSARDLILFPGAAGAVAILNRAGWPVFIVTNQAGVGLGFMSEEDLTDVHEKLKADFAVEGASVTEIVACTHRPDAGCICRKPKPGMLNDLVKRYDVDPSLSYMVGDRDTDVVAGRTAGMRTVYIGSDRSVDASFQCRYLVEAVDWILNDAQGGS